MSRSAINIATDGSFSLGFNTNVLPHARAFANIHIGTIAGKLNGVIPTTTPSGCRMLYTSTPADACSLYPPFNKCGTPHANSMFSSPRATSPIASDRTLPCSTLKTDASSLRFASTSSRILNMISARRDRLVARQSGNAVAAAATARSTSDTAAKSTSACCCPVAGSKTLPVRPDSPATNRPSIQCEMRFIVGPLFC